MNNTIFKSSDKTAKNVIACLLIIILALMSETKLPHHDSIQKIGISLIALVGMAQFLFSYRVNRLNRKVMIFQILSFMPFVFALLWTFLLGIGGYAYGLNISSQAFTTTAFAILQMMFVASMLINFKEKTIDIVFWYLVVSFGITIILALKGYGVVQIIQLYKTIYNPLERHDVGVAVVPVVLYYAYLWIAKSVHSKKNLLRSTVMLMILLMAGKRSAYVSIALGIMAIFVFTLKVHKQYKFTRIIGIIMVMILYGYVVLIQTGGLDWICDQLQISTTGRLYVWNWFRDQYNISPFYIGKGLQYIHLYMMANLAETGSATNMVNQYHYLHNSVLQLYIELGFYGFLLWFTYLFLIFPHWIRKKVGTECYQLYMIQMVAMVFMFMTDNVLTYPVYQTTLYICICGLLYYNNANELKRGPVYEES